MKTRREQEYEEWIERARKDMKRKNDTRNDIPANLLELGAQGSNKLTQLISQIHKTGMWPKDFIDITLISLKKKQQPKKCNGNRTISMISNTGKNLAWFQKWGGSRDAIGIHISEPQNTQPIFKL